MNILKNKSQIELLSEMEKIATRMNQKSALFYELAHNIPEYSYWLQRTINSKDNISEDGVKLFNIFFELMNKIKDEKDAPRSIYNLTKNPAFRMFNQPVESKRRTYVVFDVPNIINTFAFEQMNEKGFENAEIKFFTPDLLDVLFKKYIYIFPYVEEIVFFSTAKYYVINKHIKHLAQKDSRIILHVNSETLYDKKTKKTVYKDIDDKVINYLELFTERVFIDENLEARLILFAADWCYAKPLENLMDRFNVPVTCVFHKNSFPDDYKQLYEFNNEPDYLSLYGEKQFYTRYFSNKDLEDAL